jgi:3-hydroxybutyryl-CoA dehydrogenase
VTLIDVSAEALAKARRRSRRTSIGRSRRARSTPPPRTATLARLDRAPSLDAVADATLVIEAATERPELKFQIFADLDRLAPAGAILATNTSSISITQIAAKTKRPEQVVGMHFMNPCR